MKWLTVVALTVLVACGPSEADRARDRVAVERVLARDVAVAGVSHEADLVLGKGDRQEAAGIVRSRAIPAADENARAALALRPTTPWGKARVEDLSALTRDRRASLTSYAAALEGDDGNALLASIEAQQGIERRALALWQTVARNDP